MTSTDDLQTLEYAHEVQARVAAEVATLARPDSPLRRITTGPGRQLRARLVHEAAQASPGPFAWGDVVHLGAAVELLHLGSLAHDDVVDGARMRRGVEFTIADDREAESRLIEGLGCAHAAIDLVTRTSESYARIFAARLPALATGQILDAQRSGRSLEPAEVVDLHAQKTGSLFVTSIELGLVVAQAASRRRMQLSHAIGSSLGVTYQLVDDCRELCGVETMKSTPDLVTGRRLYTVGGGGAPVEHALEVAGGSLAAARSLWRECFDRSPAADGAFGLISGMLHDLRHP